MPLKDLNLNELRIFESVYRNGGMTIAAQELHLTQSGVSQHISSLEAVLDVKLFDRLKRKLFPTPAARSLYEACQKGFAALESTLADIKGGSQTLVGTLRIGMPQQFGAHIIAPLLGEFAQVNPLLKFEIQFEYSQFILGELIKGELDLAFVDEFSRHPSIQTESVYTERLDLCISKSLLKKNSKISHSKEFYESLTYVDYDLIRPLALNWFQHHLKTKHVKINYRSIAPATQGVAALIVAGMGAGILPDHVSEPLFIKNKIHIFQSPEKPLTNKIALAQLKDRTQSHAVSEFAKWLKQKLLEIAK